MYTYALGDVVNCYMGYVQYPHGSIECFMHYHYWILHTIIDYAPTLLLSANDSLYLSWSHWASLVPFL